MYKIAYTTGTYMIANLVLDTHTPQHETIPVKPVIVKSVVWVLNKRGKKQYCMRSANNNKSIDIKLSVDDVPPEQPPSGMLKSK